MNRIESKKPINDLSYDLYERAMTFQGGGHMPSNFSVNGRFLPGAIEKKCFNIAKVRLLKMFMIL